ncbi:MAG: DNA mismatch repair endonuclease MutL [Proteobacteria bacterium]|nr:DNA mismatch repair endonuclease MutL [Pseudomonadota bacterium]
MANIRILPEILSNKIAAGEVVERPSSVIKELLENAIDADSTRIHIEIEQGGRALIQVSDNGKGMNADDALLSIERYATSKIIADKDLFSIRTLGFRGEALPSIASVSRFTMITRDKDSPAGTKITVHGGKIKDVTEVGAPIGTMISVSQLFFNTPARRKFLKSVNTEMSHIADTISSMALGWPEIQFRLNHNGKLVKTWTQSGDPFIRAVDIFGNDTRTHLKKLDYREGEITLSGWISTPDTHRSTSQKIYIFVNGRYIRDRGLQHALFEGYRGRLVKGRFPLAVLFIDISPDKVDVNVHPTKHEVRFADKTHIYHMLKETVSNVLSDSERARWATPKEKIERKTDSKPSPSPGIPAQMPYSRSPYQAPLDLQAGYLNMPANNSVSYQPGPEIRESRPEAMDYSDKPLADKAPEAFVSPKKTSAYEQKTFWEESFFQSLHIIGQFRNTYILCESSEGLILVDQHAAHERIYYEKLKHKSGLSQIPVQHLLVPETLELGYQEAALLEKLIPNLQLLGVEVEPFGGNTFIIKSVPALLADREIKPVVIEMVEKMLDADFSKGLEEKLDQCLIIMACHSVIRARQPLTEKEMRVLLEQLDACSNPSHCPHGRPTWIQWTKTDIEKKFSRIV